MTDRLRIAIAGLGAMGRQHARVVSEMAGAELVLACDRSREARSWAEETFGVATTDDWRRLPEHNVDGVVNALPTPEHHATTLELLDAGLGVLVEKPIAASVDEANALITAAERGGRTLMVGHIERFNPAIRRLQEVIASGTLGEIVNVSSRRVGVARPTAPRTNVVVDLAIHDIDVCSYLLREQGRLVFASGITLASNLLEDHADLVLRYGGTVASLQANWITPVKIRRIAVTGTSGFAEVDYLTQSLRVYRGVPAEFKGAVWNYFAVAHESEPQNVAVERVEPLRAELENFVRALRGEEAPLGDPRQATQALALAIAATDMIRGRLTA